ncbi:metal ABC transporter ATP-binding protein [Paenibacillus harenae]|uniref:Zinc transport system ATP-binding protein n=1 Tax=Paenibacillus harenae TaxID=306543 RepID=A0ABT9TWB4_PAEHA|nr:ABC transporter ATP-binding protein [Paenibacillus harenae]MDQ0058316.1 zinc transport system ATP-binding protein [Paenibacillus harenae]MDQ0111661.1 zinc transport system ATP-binding protein [Paenibacillus harenae]
MLQSKTITSETPNCHQEVISLDGVSFSYQQQPVITNVSFGVKERDFIGLIGTNGAGKTTLLRMIVGLLRPTQGQIRLFGEPVEKFKHWERIGYVPQKNSLNPLFPAVVREVVLSGLYGRNKLFKKVTKEDHQKCDDALHAMGIEDLSEKRIGLLSGGQQQRVFLARALINNPSLLILDEPTVGIDTETQESFFHMIKHMHQHHSMTFLMVSHDMDMIRSYLGQQPASESGKLKFYIRHSHETQDCVENNLAHSLKGLREQLESGKEVVRIGDRN